MSGDASSRWRTRNPRQYWASSAYDAARKRALREGVPFDLTSAFLAGIAPDTCPILGVPLVYGRKALGARSPRANSPSVDRLRQGCGYTAGNVRVISNRANTIRGCYSPDEIIAVGLDALRLERAAEDE